MNDKRIHIEFFSSGYCTASSRHVFPDEHSSMMTFPAFWAYIEHPVLGKILFDTGYSTRFYDATRCLPNRIYRWITPVYHNNEESCINQLSIRGVNSQEIGSIVISHFHADHTGGLMDFPEAKIWCSKAALENALQKSRHLSVFRGILKEQIPVDIRSKASFPEKELAKWEMGGLTLWKWSENISFVELPGHARGQLGLYIQNSDKGNLLLCADAAWSSESVRRKIYPSRIVSLLSDSYSEMKSTLDKLHNLTVSGHDIVIIPTHCNETLNLTKS